MGQLKKWVLMIKVFIQLNGPPSGYKGKRRFLKAALTSMYGSDYPYHFRNHTRSELANETVCYIKSHKQNKRECSMLTVF